MNFERATPKNTHHQVHKPLYEVLAVAKITPKQTKRSIVSRFTIQPVERRTRLQIRGISIVVIIGETSIPQWIWVMGVQSWPPSSSLFGENFLLYLFEHAEPRNAPRAHFSELFPLGEHDNSALTRALSRDGSTIPCHAAAPTEQTNKPTKH